VRSRTPYFYLNVTWREISFGVTIWLYWYVSSPPNFSFAPYYIWTEAVGSTGVTQNAWYITFEKLPPPPSPTKILMHLDAGDKSQHTHLQSPTSFATLCSLNIYHFYNSSVAREISLFRGNTNWQVKILTTVQRTQTHALRKVWNNAGS
jgi:hypothetical protein